MRELTFSGFLKRYVRELSFQDTNSVYKLSAEAVKENPRLREPLFLYALFSDKMSVLMQACRNSELLAYYEPLLKCSANEMTSMLSSKSDKLAPEYHKVWRSYQSLKNRNKTDNDTKELMRKKVKRLQNETGVTNYRIYTDLKLNPGNLNAWLKHGDSEKVSLDTARQTLRYVESVRAQL